MECNSENAYLETDQQQWKLKWSQQTEQENYTGKLCHPRPLLTFEGLQRLMNRKGKNLLGKI